MKTNRNMILPEKEFTSQAANFVDNKTKPTSTKNKVKKPPQVVGDWTVMYNNKIDIEGPVQTTVSKKLKVHVESNDGSTKYTVTGLRAADATIGDMSPKAIRAQAAESA